MTKVIQFPDCSSCIHKAGFICTLSHMKTEHGDMYQTTTITVGTNTCNYKPKRWSLLGGNYGETVR